MFLVQLLFMEQTLNNGVFIIVRAAERQMQLVLYDKRTAIFKNVIADNGMQCGWKAS